MQVDTFTDFLKESGIKDENADLATKFAGTMLSACRQGYATCGITPGGMGTIHYAVDGSKLVALARISEICSAFPGKTPQVSGGSWSFSSRHMLSNCTVSLHSLHLGLVLPRRIQ